MSFEQQPSVRGVRAKYFNAFRLTTYILILFALGHTRGALVGTPKFGPGANTVLDAMRTVHFQCQTSDCTCYGFYLVFGWMVTIFFLLPAAGTRFLGGVSEAEQRQLTRITWALFVR